MEYHSAVVPLWQRPFCSARARVREELPWVKMILLLHRAGGGGSVGECFMVRQGGLAQAPGMLT